MPFLPQSMKFIVQTNIFFPHRFTPRTLLSRALAKQGFVRQQLHSVIHWLQQCQVCAQTVKVPSLCLGCTGHNGSDFCWITSLTVPEGWVTAFLNSMHNASQLYVRTYVSSLSSNSHRHLRVIGCDILWLLVVYVSVRVEQLNGHITNVKQDHFEYSGVPHTVLNGCERYHIHWFYNLGLTK